MPISYSPRTGQHHHNLRTYKGSSSSRLAQWNLLALLLQFLRYHLDCVAASTGSRPTHAATVPSTSGRKGAHPLTQLVGTRLGLPRITASANPLYGAGDRDFHSDWFAVSMPPLDGPVHVLLLDDTWTTGARAQSLAYALKKAGAVSVATVILGRHVNPVYEPSRQLMSAIAGTLFDPNDARRSLTPELTTGIQGGVARAQLVAQFPVIRGDSKSPNSAPSSGLASTPRHTLCRSPDRQRR